MPGRAPCAARRVYALSRCAHFVLPFAVTGGIVKVGRGQAGVFPPARVVVAAYAFGALGGFLLPVLALLNSLYGFIEAFCTVQDSQDFKPFSFERFCDKLFQLANIHAFVPFHVFQLLRWFCRLAHRRLPQASGAQRAGRFAMPVPCAPSAAPPGHAHCVTHTRLPRGAQGAIILLRPRPHKP